MTQGAHLELWALSSRPGMTDPEATPLPQAAREASAALALEKP